MVRALGMGSCLSGDVASAHALPYALAAAAAATAPTSASDVGSDNKSGNLRKKMRRDTSFDTKLEMWLHRVPERLFLNGSSEVASLFSKQGKKGINQDAMIVWEVENGGLYSKCNHFDDKVIHVLLGYLQNAQPYHGDMHNPAMGVNMVSVSISDTVSVMAVPKNFGSKTDTIFCGVFDGHGPAGHMVAKKVRNCLPLKLSAQLQLNSILKDNIRSNHYDIRSNALESVASEETALTATDEEARTFNYKDNHTDIFMIMRESFLKAFKLMDKELKLHPSIDCYCSGTTAVTLVKQKQDLVIANIGDSRAVLGTRDENDSLIAVQLTVDLKPDLPREAERIRRRKGRIFALQNEPEVARVWLPNYNSPGLAMARAFGDFCLKDFGLISVPDISYRRLTGKDEFVVLATDGVWDVLSNKEVVDIVASAPQSAAARVLVEVAVAAWKLKFPYAKVDDCAVVCLFLDSNSNHYSASNSTL